MYTAKLTPHNQQQNSKISFNGLFGKSKHSISEELGISKNTEDRLINTAEKLNKFTIKSCDSVEIMLDTFYDTKQNKTNLYKNFLKQMKKVASSISFKTKKFPSNNDFSDLYSSIGQMLEHNATSEADKAFVDSFQRVSDSIKTNDKELIKKTTFEFMDNVIKYLKEAPKEACPEKEFLIELCESFKNIAEKPNDKMALKNIFVCCSKLIKKALANVEIRNFIKFVNHMK